MSRKSPSRVQPEPSWWRRELHKLGEYLVVAVVLVGVVGFVHFGPPRYWGSFIGMTNAEVRQHLGQPDFDDNDDNDNVETLGWHQGFQVGLFLDFQDGVVISQRRVSR